MSTVKQNRFKNLCELHKEWTEAGVKASRATTHRRVKQFGYSCHQRGLTWAKEKKNWTVVQWSKVLFSDESKFCISFGNQGPRVWRKGGEAHSPSCLKSRVKFPQSVMIWGEMSSAGIGPLCFLKTNVTAPVYQYILEHFMLPSADQLFKVADFIFQQDLAPAHTAKSTKSWLNDHGMVLVRLTGQQTHQTRGKWETRDQKMQMSWRPLSKKPGFPYHLSSATNWSPPLLHNFDERLWSTSNVDLCIYAPLKALLRRNWVAMYAAASTYLIHFKIEMKGLQLRLNVSLSFWV